MLRPEDIHDAEFSTKFKGYNIDEVNDFLDRVTMDYKSLYQSVDKLTSENRKLIRFKRTNATHISDISQALVTAQKAAKGVIDRAKQRSNHMVDDAQVYCKDKQDSADQNGNAIVQNAEQQASQLILNAQFKVARLQIVISKLNTKARAYRQTLRDSLKHQLKALDDTKSVSNPVDTGKPIDLSALLDFHKRKSAIKPVKESSVIVYYPNGSKKALN